MQKFLVDTNVWIDFLNKRENAIDLINKLAQTGEVFSSILTITELRAGWTDEKSQHYLPIFYAQTKIIDISIEIAELAGRFLQVYKTKGISLPTIDTIIGSTAILENCQLVTGNKKDFPMPEIKIYPISERD